MHLLLFPSEMSCLDFRDGKYLYQYHTELISLIAAHRIKRAWNNGISRSPVTKNCTNLLNDSKY
jgi:hypothetical protein